MKNYKYIIGGILGALLTFTGTVFALPYFSSHQTMLPFVNNSYDLGTTSLKWRNVYIQGSDGCLQLSSGLINSSGSACGGSGVFPFTSVAGYNSTSTALGLLKGLFSTASSTVTASLFNIMGLSNGCVEIASNLLTSTGSACGTGGVASAYDIATTSSIAISGLSYFTKTAGITTLGSVATTTVTASLPLSLSNPVVKVGGSNSVLSLDTSGAWSGSAGTRYPTR